MVFRAVSALMALLCVWAAALQGNDPDPERWVLMYLAVALIALIGALGRPVPRAALSLAVVALAWAGAIAPELWGRWAPSDLTESMANKRPELEYGREFVGLLILAGYSLFAAHRMRKLDEGARASQRDAVR